ncbi:MAG TPA: BrnT family toxin [Desulfuromonadales bacterium]|nr:BrnT family toxin [Desulfuromonadales bacterium]
MAAGECCSVMRRVGILQINPNLVFTSEHVQDSPGRHISMSGKKIQSRLLLVVFTERRGKVRIISSRKSTAKEKKLYESY